MKKLMVFLVICIWLFLPMMIIFEWFVPSYRLCYYDASEEQLLMGSSSVNDSYSIEAYRVKRSILVDYSIKVYIIKEDSKRMIYRGYHEKDVEIKWLSDSIVNINGTVLDLSYDNQVYDWCN